MTLTEPTVFGAYRPVPGRRDELVDEHGAIRPAWTAVAGVLEQIGPTELLNRRVEARRLLRGDGVTYNVYGDPTGRSSRWQLDPLPLVWSSEEWAAVEQGVAQRAELLSALLDDLYGARSVFRTRVLPPEAVLAHPGYLRPLVGAGPSDGRGGLVLYAADLVRDADGYPVVLNDRTQAPSGAGYSLENRLVVSRVLPSLYRSAHVHRTAPFFRILRSSLAARSGSIADDPRVVVLSPGTYNESHFEHAFLASQLGYTLVVGSDLVVRNGRVHLQSLGGDEPVDAVVRRVDGEWCDPLELRPDSQLGVPGLVEAARRGTITMANHLGSGVLESPSVMAFLPQLSHALLGQPLLLPQARTWWCGEPAMLATVLARLDTLVVKPLTPWRGRRVIFSSELHPAERDALVHDIRRSPHRFVGQELVVPSTAPSLDASGAIVPRAAVLRAYAVADHDTFTVMPGGLGRVAPDAESQLVSNQQGALSKDVWVLASEPEPATGFWLRTGPSIAGIDPAGTLPSRTVENLFWLGRYAERAEGIVRLLRSTLDRRLELQARLTPGSDDTIAALLAAVASLTGSQPGFTGFTRFTGEDGGAGRPAAMPELLAIVADGTRPGSLVSTLAGLTGAADAVRDQLGRDSWLALDALDRVLRPLAGATPDHAETLLPPILADTLLNLLAFAGLATESMVRDPGWAAMDVGRRIERSLQLFGLLRTTLVPVRSTAAESLTIESTLIAAESIITYRRRYRGQAQVATVLDLLLLDDGNPRSAAFQLAAIEQGLAALPRRSSEAAGLGDDERVAVRARAALRVADTRVLARPSDTDGANRSALDALLAQLSGLMSTLSEEIERTHFTHLQQRPLLLHLDDGYAP